MNIRRCLAISHWWTETGDRVQVTGDRVQVTGDRVKSL
ncbi:hypothetical protein B6N60_04618 [Richelia sinica FACHB-800]|uniref:Uncharacterized protein n=1 Tax=Richelia sinica FACHB-800 TaxID=1357546 RepID=A0A975TD77_9NOST|nr:hypothetical protein B6N60_04618 [Richelia sinica FACHB-800]